MLWVTTNLTGAYRLRSSTFIHFHVKCVDMWNLVVVFCCFACAGMFVSRLTELPTVLTFQDLYIKRSHLGELGLMSFVRHRHESQVGMHCAVVYMKRAIQQAVSYTHLTLPTKRIV